MTQDQAKDLEAIAKRLGFKAMARPCPLASVGHEVAFVDTRGGELLALRPHDGVCIMKSGLAARENV
jgi:hypothetical protein